MAAAQVRWPGKKMTAGEEEDGNSTPPASATTRRYYHTRGILTYLLSVYPRAPSKPQGSDTQQPRSRLASRISKLSVNSDDGSAGYQSDDSTAEPPATAQDDEKKIDNIITLLENDTVDQDDKPEQLKAALLQYIAPREGLPELDPLILAVLHRYKEDVAPSGATVPPLPSAASTPSKPSVSRSSSFRKAPGSLSLAAVRTSQGIAGGSLASSVGSAGGSAKTPSSPFRSASPALRSLTPTGSPWNSPRSLSLSLPLSAAASEFKPTGVSSPSLSAGVRSRSPMPIAQQAQEKWAATNSPLGTPKTGTAPGSATSAASSPSYFPRVIDPGLHQSLAAGARARLPWADTTDSSASASVSGGDTDDEENPQPFEYRQHAGPQDSAYIDSSGPPSTTSWEEEYGQPPEEFNPFGTGQQKAWDATNPNDEYAGGFTPTLEAEGMNFDTSGATGVSSTVSGLGADGGYSMTPFDVLYSIFAGSNVSAAVLEEALVMTGWDVDKAMEYIIDTQPGGPDGMPLTPGGSSYQHQHQMQAGAPPFQPQVPMQLQMPQTRAVPGSGSRPMLVSHDSFEGYNPRGGPRMLNNGFSSTNSTPGTPGAEASRGVGSRVCRYYLAGNCLRSDCKFSHDVSKAVCKFWLRGHCLKGDGRCDFLHAIPPVMRADFEQRARARRNSQGGNEADNEQGIDLDFPTLGAEPRSSRSAIKYQMRSAPIVDAGRSRFAGAVKFGRPGSSLPPGSVVAAGNQTMAAAASSSARSAPTMTNTSKEAPAPRQSSRLFLRPPALLPTLPTGPALTSLYAKYRSSFLELGANRNKCLARAADCWKRGDGAGARKWSREAQDWNRQVAIEGRDSAVRIIEERKKLLKQALLDQAGGKAGTTDDANDRRVRGAEKAGGVCLGVVSQSFLPANVRAQTVDERTEVALDLHGLHSDEAVSFLGDFLLKLEHERFGGIAYVVVGQQKHSGQQDPEAGKTAHRLRLEQACTEFLGDQGWPWVNHNGILCIDAMR